MAHTGLDERIQILLIFRVENFKWKFTPYHRNLDKENLCRSGFYFPLIFYFIRRCFPLVIKDIWHISHVPTKLKLKIRTQSIPSGTHRQKYSTHSLSLIKPSCNYNITNGGISMARWLFIFGICIAFDHELFRRAFLLINLSLLKSEWLKAILDDRLQWIVVARTNLLPEFVYWHFIQMTLLSFLSIDLVLAVRKLGTCFLAPAKM